MDIVMDFIRNNYSDGEPVFVSDIQIQGFSNSCIRQQLKRLADSGRLLRYDKGIYYLPKKSRLKSGYCPSADTVARYKYISRRGKVSGYYTGFTFANQLGISTQVPYKTEIVSNYSSAVVRDVRIGNREFAVRRPRVHVTSQNYQTLQLLELLKDISVYTDTDQETVKKCLERYIIKSQIKRDDVSDYISYFPAKTYKNIYDLELSHVFA